MNTKHKIGIDIGRTKIEFIVTDNRVEKRLFKKRVLTPKNDYQEFIEIIKKETVLIANNFNSTQGKKALEDTLPKQRHVKLLKNELGDASGSSVCITPYSRLNNEKNRY